MVEKTAVATCETACHSIFTLGLGDDTLRLFSRPQPGHRITATRDQILIQIDKSLLENSPHAEHRAAAAAMSATLQGDWGGPEFPEYDCPSELVDQVAAAVARTK